MRKNPSVFMADLNDMTVVQKTREVMESDTSNAEFYFECASAAWDYLNEACRKSLVMTARDVEKLRESLRRAEQEAAELAAQLADPEIYDDHQLVRDLADRHEEATAKAEALLAEWMTAQEQLDAADR